MVCGVENIATLLSQVDLSATMSGASTAAMSAMLKNVRRLSFHLVRSPFLGHNQPWDGGSKSYMILTVGVGGIRRRCPNHPKSSLGNLC